MDRHSFLQTLARVRDRQTQLVTDLDMSQRETNTAGNRFGHKSETDMQTQLVTEFCWSQRQADTAGNRLGHKSETGRHSC